MNKLFKLQIYLQIYDLMLLPGYMVPDEDELSSTMLDDEAEEEDDDEEMAEEDIDDSIMNAIKGIYFIGPYFNFSIAILKIIL